MEDSNHRNLYTGTDIELLIGHATILKPGLWQSVVQATQAHHQIVAVSL